MLKLTSAIKFDQQLRDARGEGARADHDVRTTTTKPAFAAWLVVFAAPIFSGLLYAAVWLLLQVVR